MVVASLPVIDISPFRIAASAKSASAAAKLLVAKELGEACKKYGFFYLTGHGIRAERLEMAHRLAKQFFTDRNEDEKFNLFGIKDGRARGYQKLGQNVTKYKRDWHEALDYYAEPGLLPKNASPLQTHLFGQENVWPPEMKQFYADYIREMLGLGQSVMQAMALSLDLPENFFDPLTDKSFWVIRIIGYPSLSKKTLDEVCEKKDALDQQGMLSCGEHTDYGCLTLLNQDETKGALQVLSQGEWINADPIAGALVVNIGDMIEFWTDGLYKSTLHRVIHGGSGYRTSVPFFYEPNFDAIIKPIVAGKGGEIKTKVYGDHLTGKVSSNFEWNHDQQQ